MEALERLSIIKASQMLIKMISGYCRNSHGTPGPPFRTTKDAAPTKAFLCLEMPVKFKEWAVEEASHGKHSWTEDKRVHRKEVCAKAFTSPARINSTNHTFPL